MPIHISGMNAIKIALGLTDVIEGEIRDAGGAPLAGANVTFGVTIPAAGGVNAVEFMERDPWGDLRPKRAAGAITDATHGTFQMVVRGVREGECEVAVRCGLETATIQVKVEPSAILAVAPGGGAVIAGADGRAYAIRGNAVAAINPAGVAALALGPGRPALPAGPGMPNVIIIDI